MSKADKLPYRPCVGIMLTDGQGRVFVGRRLDTPDAWQMPQGGIDDGESPRQAAMRELLEEIGTDAAEIVAETDAFVLVHRSTGVAELGGEDPQRGPGLVQLFSNEDDLAEDPPEAERPPALHLVEDSAEPELP